MNQPEPFPPAPTLSNVDLENVIAHLLSAQTALNELEQWATHVTGAPVLKAKLRTAISEVGQARHKLGGEWYRRYGDKR